MPSVTVGAGYSKRRREDTLPLRPELVGAMRDYLSERMAATSAFPMPNRNRIVIIFRADLDAAGIA